MGRKLSTAAAIACLATAAGAGPALGAVRTRTCSSIASCSTSLASPLRVTSTLGGGPPTSSRVDVAVKPAPTATVGARNQSGKLVEKVDVGRGITCRGYANRDPSTFEFQLLTATPLRITYVIVDRIKNTTANGIGFCLATTSAFRTASGRSAAPTRLPDGTRGHVGLLPMCPNPASAPGAAPVPCIALVRTVTDPRSSTGVDVILRVRVPTQTTGDPWGGS